MAESENAPQPPRAEATDTLVGKVLNERFRVMERIGSGGMGRVYKALQAPLDRVVALKVLNPSYSVEQDPAFAKRFFLEASVSSKLTHPNSITIFDYGRTDDGIFFIAMEYLQGRTLHQIIAAEGCLPAPRVVHIARQICRALREAHGLGIVHRDLKPANVMLLHHGDDEDFVKVLDFGLVKFFGDGPHENDGGELTQGGVFLGSPTYMAPEQARNEADPRSDIYSLGIVMYHMLSGRPPFSGKAPVDIILKHVNEPPPPFRPELKVPQDLEAVLQRALEKDPDARYGSMDEFLDALKRLGTLSPSDILMSDSLASSAPRPSGAMSRPISRSGAVVPSRPGTPAQPSAPRPIASSAFRLGDDNEVTERRAPWRHPVALGMTGLVAALGLGAAAMLALRPKPIPAHPTIVLPEQPLPSALPPQPGPVERSLHVESDPAGASVSLNGKLLGQTPLDTRVSADGAPPSLSIAAMGYAPATVTAALVGDAFTARARLQRVPPPTPRPEPHTSPSGSQRNHSSKKKGGSSAPPSGYKDDPYK